MVLTATGDGDMLPALAIFKGKRKLRFKSPDDAHVQPKGWMDSELMLRWFKAVILPYTKVKKKRTLLVIDSFSTHETDEFLALAHASNVDVTTIPGGCASKIRWLEVCLDKPFKSILRHHWVSILIQWWQPLLTTASKVTL